VGVLEAKSLAITLLIIGLIAGSLLGSYGFPRTSTITETLTQIETLTETTTTTSTTVTTTTITEYHYFTETITTTTPAWRYTGTVLEYEGAWVIEVEHYGYEVIWVEKNYKVRVSLKADGPIWVYVFALADYASWVYGEEVSPIAEKKASTITLEVLVPVSDYYAIIFYNDGAADITIYSYKIEILTP